MNAEDSKSCWCAVAIVGIVALVLVFLWLVPARGDEPDLLASGRAALAALADRIEADPDAPQWKRDLVAHAVAHADEAEVFRAHTVYYHPREAGANWRKWAGTSTGTLVRPGVASCTVAYRREWMGAWIWFEGHGLCKVEDNFPESRSRSMFDLAVWAKPGQTYDQWIWDDSRVAIARTRNVYTTAVVVKPRGGWR